MKFLIALTLLLAGVAAQAQQPNWRDYYAASGAEVQQMQASADLELFQSQIALRKATNELLSASLFACQNKVIKSCVNAALAITELQNIDAQWILTHHITVDDWKTDLKNFDDLSQQIKHITG